eukprot:scaffold6007_cov183-Amphora_coffeaeformis.AAC.18
MDGKSWTRCIPVSLIVREDGIKGRENVPVAPGERMCPACQTAPVTSIRLLPMAIGDLDRAVQLRREAAEANQGRRGVLRDNKDDGVKLKFADAPPEASYLLLTHGGSGGKLSSVNDYQRTGRWTDEERAYTDYLVEAFDQGTIPMEPGVKLGEFLGELLLCKNSRLTKKMKYAKLSVRSYDFVHPMTMIDAEKLSSLEHKFLESIPSEHLRLELGFHLTRVWRSHLSTLCLKINSKLLDFSEWFQSLEEMEHRAIEADDIFRKTRRERMGSMLRGGNNNNNKTDMKRAISANSMHAQAPSAKRLKMETFQPLAVASGRITGSGASVTDASSEEGTGTDLIKDMLDLSNRPSDYEDDYTKILDDLVNGPSIGLVVQHPAFKESHSSAPQVNRTPKESKSSAFLQEIASYMESHNLSFQHADVWVPLPTSDARPGPTTTLLHAGSVTRTDIGGDLFGRLNNLGYYSTKFAFTSGVGLPGRVLQKVKAYCERALTEADPRFYESSGGGDNYGIKSGFGVCLSTNSTRIVVCFYSVNNIPEDLEGAAKACFTHLSRLCPQPKWHPSIEIAPLRAGTAYEGAGMAGSRAAVEDGSVASASTYHSKASEGDDLVDRQIATLLGEYMPLATLSKSGKNSEVDALVPHFMSLRLLLLRSSGKRSPDVTEAIDLIRKSYSGYSRDSRRSDEEVAHLIVKDWRYIRLALVPPTTTVLGIPQSDQSHVSRESGTASLNGVKSEAATPIVAPKPLTYIYPDAVCRGS